jgi:prepilin-type N-terminal cleavage/methylation domain-containing protein
MRVAARRGAGFTLVELAVVLAIVGLLLGSLMFTLSAQSEQRSLEETRRRLDHARDLLLGFAIAKGRLPCPATAASGGDEAPAAGGACTTFYGGWLPARALGYQNVDTGGFAVDAWGNRIRYAVSGVAPSNCSGTSTAPHFTSAINLKANGISCQPNDLLVCKSATGITGTTCGTAFGTSGENQWTTSDLVVAVVFSIGKNGSTGGGVGADELANLNGDRIFVHHTPTPVESANGEFDDQFLWVTVGELYGKMVAAGVLP